MLLTPSPLSQTVTPSRTPPPSSVTYFMDGPLHCILMPYFLHGFFVISSKNAVFFALFCHDCLLFLFLISYETTGI